ncbi:MAG: zinc ribbon domain-containing protein, partial [Chloroflexota bacterium]
AISRVRAQKQVSPEAAPLPVKATAVPANGQTHFCPECGVKVGAGDKFCAACGHKLVIPA